ncbi:MAG: alanine racemase [Treponema sp.]|nr:alanine racemase [Treponema sp.]
MRATKAIINILNLRFNFRNIKKTVAPGVKICCAVKADAYGHGAVPVAKALTEEGADVLAVATVDEGIELRNAGIKVPILMLSLCSPEEVAEAVRYSITPFVFDGEYIQLFASVCKTVGIKNFPVHIAVDTGMGRIGCNPQDAGKIAEEIRKTGVLSLAGMGTHFAVSDDLSSESIEYTKDQVKKFNLAVESVRAIGMDPGIRHVANSAAAVYNPEYQMDMVRPGIILYGYYADQITRNVLNEKGISLELKPVMTVETVVCAIRKFEKGKSVGYGRTWTAPEDTYVAILPVGYEDGWFRRFSCENMGVTINGKKYPIRGRICMDQCMVELGQNHGVKRWDKAVLFGSQEDGALQTAQDIADSTGTIPYEITCGISKRVPRVFHDKEL